MVSQATRMVYFSIWFSQHNYHYYNVLCNNHDNHTLQPHIIDYWLWPCGWMTGDKVGGRMGVWIDEKMIGEMSVLTNAVMNNDYSLSWLQILLAHHGTISQRQLICRASRRLHGLQRERQGEEKGLKDTAYIWTRIQSFCVLTQLVCGFTHFQNEQNTQQFVSGRSEKSGYLQLEVSDLDGTFKLIGSNNCFHLSGLNSITE